MAFDPRTDYPLGSRRPGLVATPSGRPLEDVTLDALRAGALTADDVRATPGTLRLQAEVARAAGRVELAANLERAGELASIPADVILEIYTALRPFRATREELAAWADRLERDYSARRCAAFVREAGEALEERGLLRTGDPASV